MQPLAAERLGVAQRHVDARCELVLAPGQRRKSALALVPMPGRQIEQHELEPGRFEPSADIRDLERIGEHELDAFESGVRRRFEAIEEG